MCGTALTIDDYMPGRIVQSDVVVFGKKETISHYFNEVEGEIIDLTKEQFPGGSVIPYGKDKLRATGAQTPEFPTTRDYLLSSPDTKRRYELLKQRVQTVLGK